MKNENEFNGILGKHLKRYWGRYFHTKNADKYRVGVPDFYIWGLQKHVCIECKFIKSVPLEDSAAWLKKHKFTPEQVTFLKCVSSTGSRAYGLVGVGDKKKMFLLDRTEIHKGNVTSETHGHWFDISTDGVNELLKHIFKDRVYGPPT